MSDKQPASSADRSDDTVDSSPSFEPPIKVPPVKSPPQALRLNCPHCQNPIEVLAEAEEEIHCPSCGSTFHVDNQQTRTWDKGKLPKLGKFELLNRLGFGAFGTVYKAFDSELKRSVALKLPRSGTIVDQDDEERFLREARSAAQLRHSGIVPIFEVGRSQQFLYIVSELVEGITLADALSAKRLSFRESAELIQQVAEALDYSHKQGVVHRDLKPSNIMLSADGTPRIMDFGLAKRETGEVTMTVEGQVLGTPAYMSPELAAGKAHEVDGRSDVYSLGVILYELLTGELPFRGNQRMLMHQVMHDEPRAPRSLNDRIPRDLETICAKAMAKEPSRRYGTAAELAADLKRYIGGQPILARPVGRVERAWRWCKRNPVVAGLSAAVVLALLGGAVVSTVFAVRASEREKEAVAEWARAEGEKARADVEKETARDASIKARRSLYLSNMSQATFAFRSADMGRVCELVNAHAVREAEEPDYREFEWYYLNHLCNQLRPFVNVRAGIGVEIAASSNGKWLAVCEAAENAAKPSTIFIHDARSSKELHRLVGPTGLKFSLAFSPEGNRLAVAANERTSEKPFLNTENAVEDKWKADNEVIIYDVPTGAVVFKTSGILPVAYTPDGKHFVVVRHGVQTPLGSTPLNRLVLVDAANGQDAGDLGGAETLAIRCVAFSNDGKRLAVGGPGSYGGMDFILGKGPYRGRTVLVYDLKDGQPRLDLNPGGDVHQLAFSPDGKELASASGEKVIRIWDVSTGRERLALVGHTGHVMGLAYADRSTLVSGSVDRTVRTWDVESGEELQVFRRHKSAIVACELDKAHHRAFSASIDGEVNAWKFWEDQDLRKYYGDARQLVCDPRGEHLMMADGAMEPVLINIATGKLKRSLFERRSRAALIACNQDGSKWATGNGAFFSRPPRGVIGLIGPTDDGAVNIWDRATGKSIKSIFNERKNREVERTEEFRGLTFLDQADRIAIATSNRVGIWNIETGKEEGHFTNGDALLINVAVHPTADVVATLAEKDQIVGGTTVSIWEPGATEPRRRLSGQYFPIRTLKFDDRDQLWSVSTQRLVVWNWKTGDIVRQFWLQPSLQAAVNPSQTRLATAGIGGELMLWDVESGQQVLNLPAFKRTIDALTFDLTGEHLIASGEDGERMASYIKVWDAPREVAIDSRVSER